MLEHTPEIGDNVTYFDMDKNPHHAVVADVHIERMVHGQPRPIVNLSVLWGDGSWRKTQFVEPAEEGAEVDILVNKWALKGEFATLQS